jgi:hypothetical protein
VDGFAIDFSALSMRPFPALWEVALELDPVEALHPVLGVCMEFAIGKAIEDPAI